MVATSSSMESALLLKQQLVKSLHISGLEESLLEYEDDSENWALVNSLGYDDDDDKHVKSSVNDRNSE